MVKFYVKVCIVKRTGTMKKIITAILLISCIITGCSNEKEKEEILCFKMSYNTDENKLHENFNTISVYFTEEDICIKHCKYSDEVEEKYMINDTETLKEYINSIKAKADNYNREDDREELQIILWDIYFETEKNKYSYTGFDDYPDYWDELWQVLLDVSDAESLEDFGF